MTAFTPNLALPYPDASDAPCDFAQDWCEFTDAVQVVLNGFEDTADRVNPVIPVASMKRDTALGDPSFPALAFRQNIPFTTVEVDTAHWVDFDTNPTLISPDVAGRLTLVGSCLFGSVNSLNGDFPYLYFNVSGVDFHIGSQVAKVNANGMLYLSAGLSEMAITVEQDVFISAGSFIRGLTGISLAIDSPPFISATVLRARLSVYWHADGAAP